MAKKKKSRISKQQRKRVAKYAQPALAGFLGIIIGVTATTFLAGIQSPANLVWAADKTVKIPKDLREFLSTKDECKTYRGAELPGGVGLWGVYQVSKNSYAKIAYGCSWNLSNYIMAVKNTQGWQLLQPVDYFAPFKEGVDPTKGALPFCAVVDQYKIPKNIEPFCINPDGTAKANEQT